VNGTYIDEGLFSWFHGGRLNASVNCIDQHIKTKADQVALIWEKDEPGQTEFITYHQLLSEVCMQREIVAFSLLMFNGIKMYVNM
jgi:acetyl-CoA synthetase